MPRGDGVTIEITYDGGSLEPNMLGKTESESITSVTLVTLLHQLKLT